MDGRCTSETERYNSEEVRKMFDINEKILKKAKSMGFGDVIIFSEELDKKQIRFANSEISVGKYWHEKRSTIFAEKDRRIASIEIMNFDDRIIEEYMKILDKNIKSIEKKKDYMGIAEGPFTYNDVEETYDKRILESEPVEFVERAINSADAKRVAGVLYIENPKTYLTTTNNIEAFDEGTKIEISIRAFMDSLASGHATSSSRVLEKFQPERAGEKAGEIAKMVKEPEKGDEGKYEVIFDPLSIGNIFSLLGHFASAFAVEAGFSFLVGKIGKKVAGENVTIKDFGNMPNGYGTRKFDDEGVPTRGTKIIENGILRTYLLNTSFAKKYNMETTANSGVIFPRAWNIFIEPGDFKKDDIFDVRRGIYITNVWYTRFQNYVSGDFSTIPRDGIFLVENGEITKSIKNIRVSDNIQRMLENISAMSSDLHQIHWWECNTPVITPYIRIKDVGITRATK